jgi:hypothetical protein
VDVPSLQDRLSDNTRPAWRRRIDPLESVERLGRDAVVVGNEVDQGAIEPIDERRDAVAQLHHSLDDHVEDRLDVGRGARDDPEDLAGGRLPVEALVEVVQRELEEAEASGADDVGAGRADAANRLQDAWLSRRFDHQVHGEVLEDVESLGRCGDSRRPRRLEHGPVRSRVHDAHDAGCGRGEEEP